MTDRIDWDRWRSTYGSRSLAEEAAFYDRVAAKHPEQQQWRQHADFTVAALEGATSVVELGPWRGELAAHAIEHVPTIGSWVGFDVCPWAVENTRCDHPAYQPVALTDWPWDTDLPAADVFVASHVLEHLSWEHLQALAAQFPKYGRLILDIPIPETVPRDWQGYRGSHMLDVSWADVAVLLVGQGFWEASREGSARVYDRLVS